MNKLILVSFILVMAPFATNGQGRLEVVIGNLRNNNGSVRVGLFNSEETFLEKAVEGKVVKASATEVTLVFESLAAGRYAVSVIHDENENGEIDKNAFGIPEEGFGFGNNAMGMFGPPSFEKATVNIENKGFITQRITLKYL